jgi:hypothetical protein
MLFVVIAALAAWGIWSAHGEYTCAKAADPKACTKKCCCKGPTKTPTM